MLRDFFQSVTGYGHFGMISTFIFLAFFVLVIVQAWTMKKKDADEFSRMPLDDSSRDSEDV